MGLNLNQAERDSGAWQKVEIYWQAELKTMRERLEALNIPDAERRELAIRIYQTKKFLAVTDAQGKEAGAD